MMDYIQLPGHLVLNTKEVYRANYPELISLLKNDLDIKEVFNQLVDHITDTIYTHEYLKFNLISHMLRCKEVNNKNNPVLDRICLNISNILERELSELKPKSLIDMNHSREIYPYHFHDLIRGSVILKRF